MKSDYSEIIKLFRNVKDNADELVNLFKRLQEEEEKEAKNESLIRWRSYPKEKPSESGLYLCAMKKSDSNYKWIEQFLYNKESDVWTDNVSFSHFPVDKVYGVAPSAWAIVDFPKLEVENETSN
nr:MAG TPA: hypothetical protein [Caudoviricetes sp.]